MDIVESRQVNEEKYRPVRITDGHEINSRKLRWIGQRHV